MSILTNEACALARNVLEDLFGKAVADVCQALLEKGPMSLAELSRSQIVASDVLKNCLLVLMQHNCIQCCIRYPSEKRKQPKFVYRANLQRILYNLRKPWIVEYVTEEFDTIRGSIVETLLENGRLRLTQIVAGVAGKRGVEADSISDETKTAFVGMIHAKLIERCPICTLSLPLDPVHPATNKRSMPKIQKGDEERMQFITEAYEQHDNDRFKVPVDLMLGAAFAESSTRKRKADRQDDGSNADQVLWRVNVQEFDRSLRHKTCIDFVTDKISPTAGSVLKCMLDVTKSSETSVVDLQYLATTSPAAVMFVQINVDVSRPVSLDEIESIFNKDAAVPGEGDDSNTLETALNALRNEQLNLVTITGQQGGRPVFSINLTQIIKCCQRIHIETTIRDRFGSKALRIFRLLLLKKQLEQKQIADLSMLDLKETRTVLYRMMKAGYVHMQDIPQTADHAASRTYFTWRVRLDDAAAQLKKDMYKAILHLHTRLLHELKKGNELMELLDMSQSHFEPVHITDKQRQQAGRLSRIVQVLEKSLFELDVTIAMMNNFAVEL